VILLGQDIDAVTFDMDGTLYSGAGVMLKTLRRLWPHRRLLIRYFKVREALRKETEPCDLRKVQADRVALATGLDPFETRVLIDELILGAWVDGLSPRAVFPGLRRFLSDLWEKGAKLGVVSDYPVDDKLLRLDLFFLPWHAVVDCEEHGVLKPSPAPFLDAAKRLGVEPSRVLHIGDREDCDVRGAHAAGMKAALFARGWRHARARRRGSEAEAVFSDYREVRV
jgi:FMN phosphatase YigB (HAD superfamily)